MDKTITHDQNNSQPLVHKFSSLNNSLFSSKSLIVFTIMILLGIGTGFIFAQNSKGQVITQGGGASASLTKGTIIGSEDMQTFKDSTEGVLKKGGIDGEGQFHLVRPGGDSQNVYLTSSIVDLSQMIDRKIKIWGETQKAQKAGWLMDVGKVEILE